MWKNISNVAIRGSNKIKYQRNKKSVFHNSERIAVLYKLSPSKNVLKEISLFLAMFIEKYVTAKPVTVEIRIQKMEKIILTKEFSESDCEINSSEVEIIELIIDIKTAIS